MNRKEFAEFLIGKTEHTKDEYEAMYPERTLSDNAMVTRFAPSPTGFVHIGSLFTSFIASRFAKQTNGVCYLRIEDTDQKRTVENGVSNIIRDLANFNIHFDEGMTSENESNGNYGPYLQSKREDIYKAYAKDLIEKDLAYPCFLSEEEMEEIRGMQEDIKARIGIYGKYAKYRNLSVEDAVAKIEAGEKYIIRLKSPGEFNNKIIVDDIIRGRMEFNENDLDIVIIKGDGLPTYHFAHAIDDHLMHTTHVIRGDEWISSLPIHIQLFNVLGFKAPKYVHLSPLMKKDNGVVRKISKRKDAEAAVSYYHEEGIPYYAVLLYLMTVANSNFEAWLDANPTGKYEDFALTFSKMSSSGSLFDMDKLLNISKNYISRLSKNEVYDMALNYSKEYDSELYELLTKYKDYSIDVFNIEREQKKPRKDLAKFSDIKEYLWYMYDELYKPLNYEFMNITDEKEISKILSTYMEKYYNVDDKESWFNNIKLLTDELGYASDMKEYKANPNNYKGNVSDIATVLRVALTSKSQTPDLYEIMRLFGKDRILNRYKKFM
ncbi:MAG: glutamate--tRNA ligase [Bacilli bacterium]|nr:glutamate--tRNA ligase [Bacilli bacterium]